MIAATEAWRRRLRVRRGQPVDRERLAVVVGTGIGGLNTLLGSWDIQKEKGYAGSVHSPCRC